VLQELTSGRGSKCTATIITPQNHFKIRYLSSLLPFLAGCPHQFQTDTLSLQSVVVVGLGASGIDIASEISHVAKEVHIAARYSKDRLGKIELYHNAWMHGEVQF